MGSIAAEIESKIRRIVVPDGYDITVKGEVSSMRDSFQKLGYGLLLAVILVYLVLAGQFRSFSDPLLILVTVPLGLSGVLTTLWLTGTRVNIQSFIGVTFMVGIAVSNGILLVEFANRARAEGAEASAAARSAARQRLRPVLMTALAGSLGVLPMAIGIGHGSESNTPLGRAVLGGLAASTLLTLFVLPSLFVAVKRKVAR